MNTLEQFLKEQKEVERYGQYLDIVSRFNNIITQGDKEIKIHLETLSRVKKENERLKEEVKRLFSGSNMMNENINNTLHNLLEVYNKSITHHKEINEMYGKEISNTDEV